MGGNSVACGMAYSMWSAMGCGPKVVGHRAIIWAAGEGGRAGHDPHLGTDKGCSGIENRGAGLSGTTRVETKSVDAGEPRVHGETLKGLAHRLGPR